MGSEHGAAGVPVLWRAAPRPRNTAKIQSPPSKRAILASSTTPHHARLGRAFDQNPHRQFTCRMRAMSYKGANHGFHNDTTAGVTTRRRAKESLAAHASNWFNNVSESLIGGSDCEEAACSPRLQAAFHLTIKCEMNPGMALPERATKKRTEATAMDGVFAARLQTCGAERVRALLVADGGATRPSSSTSCADMGPQRASGGGENGRHEFFRGTSLKHNPQETKIECAKGLRLSAAISGVAATAPEVFLIAKPGFREGPTRTISKLMLQRIRSVERKQPARGGRHRNVRDAGWPCVPSRWVGLFRLRRATGGRARRPHLRLGCAPCERGFNGENVQVTTPILWGP